MSDTVIPCPKCKSEYTYSNGMLMVCPDCNYEWSPEEELEAVPDTTIKDAYGVPLANGDTVALIKDLPVKGMLKALKSGTKVKNIRLTDSADGHNIDCKIEGLGAMALKSEFVKKI